MNMSHLPIHSYFYMPRLSITSCSIKKSSVTFIFLEMQVISQKACSSSDLFSILKGFHFEELSAKLTMHFKGRHRSYDSNLHLLYLV